MGGTKAHRCWATTSVASLLRPSFMIDDLTLSLTRRATPRRFLSTATIPIDSNSFVLQYCIHRQEVGHDLPGDEAMRTADQTRRLR